MAKRLGSRNEIHKDAFDMDPRPGLIDRTKNWIGRTATRFLGGMLDGSTSPRPSRPAETSPPTLGPRITELNVFSAPEPESRGTIGGGDAANNAAWLKHSDPDYRTSAAGDIFLGHAGGDAVPAVTEKAAEVSTRPTDLLDLSDQGPEGVPPVITGQDLPKGTQAPGPQGGPDSNPRQG